MKNIFQSRRFLPFFFTQFLGAFNDNVFKNFLIIMLTYQSVNNSALLVNISALLFILPFFLFSALGGQLGDKLEKSSFIKKIKILEIVIMTIGAVFFIFELQYGLMAILFLMGTQSALFGPVKYSLLPQHLKPQELLKGNAYVETGTFIAILLGTIYAGILTQYGENSKIYIGISVFAFSLLGLFSSFFIPEGKANNKCLVLNFNIFSENSRMIRLLKEQKKSVSRSVLSISWFWFIGAVFLTQFPILTKDFLYGDESVFIFTLTLFSLGIGIGSILAEKLSDEDVELGLVPIGSAGITVGIICLYFSTLGLTGNSTNLLNLGQFIALEGSINVIFSIFIIGVFGGIYTVPLYTLIQIRTKEKERAQVIAVNNIMNALFMVIASIYSILMLNYFTVLELLLSMGILNVLISIYIFTIVPEFAMRFLVWVILKFMYRIKSEDVKIPMKGACLVVCNHVSYMDALILSATIRRPTRFVMYYKIFNIPILNFIFKQTKAIPIAGYKENKEVYENAFKEIKKALDNEEAIFIFPEGKLTRDGNINEFKGGVDKILKESTVPVYPLALQGLWGSFFSYKKEKNKKRRFFSKVNVVGGEVIEAGQANRKNLEKRVRDLRKDKE